MRKEAVLSSQIEGTQASLDQLVLFELDPQTEQQVPDVREVSNYVQALEYGLDRVRKLPLSTRLIREMHEHLLDGVRGQDKDPGQFRRIQVHIGPDREGIEHATYVPPPPGPELDGALTALEKFLHAPSMLPPVVRLALVHYQFEAIHPFIDGNGRIGRLLISLMLCHDAILPQPLLYLSAYFERHRREYYNRLQRVSTHGEWTEWITYFAQGVAYESMDAVDRIHNLGDLRARYIAGFQRARSPALTIQLIEHLFSQPAVTVSSVAQLLHITYRPAQKHVDRLVAAGILVEVTGQQRNRVYLAREILRAIQDPHPPPGGHRPRSSP